MILHWYWKGIENRTGIEREHAYEFMLKELLDNSVDYFETQHIAAAATTTIDTRQPKIHVTIKKTEPSEKIICIAVSNTNYHHDTITTAANSNTTTTTSKATFSKEMLNYIFRSGTYYSSKRNQFKITKGALGDALKEVLCIPYVLAHENEINNWNYPLKIYAAGKIFQIHLDIDRINQRTHLEIDDDKSYDDSEEITVSLDESFFFFDSLVRIGGGKFTLNGGFRITTELQKSKNNEGIEKISEDRNFSCNATQ
jgi:hypothetical protein